MTQKEADAVEARLFLGDSYLFIYELDRLSVDA